MSSSPSPGLQPLTCCNDKSIRAHAFTHAHAPVCTWCPRAHACLVDGDGSCGDGSLYGFHGPLAARYNREKLSIAPRARDVRVHARARTHAHAHVHMAHMDM